jgi:hypothetical protein
MTKTARKGDAWGAFVAVPRGILQQWYSFLDRSRKVEEQESQPVIGLLLIKGR